MPSKKPFTPTDTLAAARIITIIKNMTGDELYEQIHEREFLDKIAKIIADTRRENFARLLHPK
jgi:hypothetical protein